MHFRFSNVQWVVCCQHGDRQHAGRSKSLAWVNTMYPCVEVTDRLTYCHFYISYYGYIELFCDSFWARHIQGQLQKKKQIITVPECTLNETSRALSLLRLPHPNKKHMVLEPMKSSSYSEKTERGLQYKMSYHLEFSRHKAHFNPFPANLRFVQTTMRE